MEQAEDVGTVAPAPVFVDDTGRRRVVTGRVARVLLVCLTAYIGLLVMGFARDPRLGPLNLPTIGFPDLGLMIPPAPMVLGEQTERSHSAPEIKVSTAGASDGDARSAPSSGRRPAPGSDSGTGTPGLSTSPSGVAPARASAPTGQPAGSGTTTTSTSATTSTSTPGDNPEATSTPVTTAPTTPSNTTPTTPAQGPVSAKGPDGSGPPGYGTQSPGQERKATKTGV